MDYESNRYWTVNGNKIQKLNLLKGEYISQWEQSSLVVAKPDKELNRMENLYRWHFLTGNKEQLDPTETPEECSATNFERCQHEGVSRSSFVERIDANHYVHYSHVIFDGTVIGSDFAKVVSTGRQFSFNSFKISLIQGS